MSEQSKSLKNIFNPLSKAWMLAPVVGAAAVIAGHVLPGPLGFTSPWALSALGLVPPLWQVLRNMPLDPRLTFFAPLVLLRKIVSEEKSPTRMPLPQRLLGVSILALTSIAAAQPHINPDKALEGKGPLLAVISNGWQAGKNWTPHKEAAKHIIERGERENRQVLLLPTAPPADGNPIRVITPRNAAEAERIIEDMKPQPWPDDLDAALKEVKALQLKETASIVWLNDGGDEPGTLALAQELKNIGHLTVMQDPPEAQAHLLAPPDAGAETLTLSVSRADATKKETVILSASDESGKVLDQIEAPFKAGENEVKATFKLPPEVQNLLTGIGISGENTAGARVMLDERSRRRPVGLVTTDSSNALPSLLSEANYVEKALGSSVELHKGDIQDLLKHKLAVIILTDDAGISDAARKKLSEWVNSGGTLLRFAGPNLAAQTKTDDELLPVRLEPGEHALNGKLSGSGPVRLEKFDAKSPLANFSVPPNVVVERDIQVKADPELDKKTWAWLSNKTPFVMADQRGKGYVVLVDTTASPAWSNFALSDSFITMLRTVVSRSQSVNGDADGTSAALPPLRTLNGFGRFETPPSAVQPLNDKAIAAGKIGPQSPPGFYGNESVREALNLASGVPAMAPAPKMPDGVDTAIYATAKHESNLTGAMFAMAAVMLMLDWGILIKQRKVGSPDSRPVAAGAAPRP